MKSIEYTTKTVGGFDIIGIDVTTCNEDGQAADDINALWQRFFQEAIGDNIPNRTGQSIIAAYTDYEGDHTKPYRFILGCKVSDTDTVPEGMIVHHIPESKYGVFASIGEQPTSLIRSWEHIWEMESLPRAFTTDYEEYGPRFFEPNLHEILIHIALKAVQ